MIRLRELEVHHTDLALGYSFADILDPVVRVLLDDVSRHLRGTVIDLPGPVRRAGKAISAAGLEHRADAVVGSFFDELPARADGYLLSSILHNWNDAAAARIMRRCADAASTTGRVFVVDYFDEQSVQTEGDLRMLCYFGGRQHTPEQLSELAGSAGLEIASTLPAGRMSIVELRASR